MSKIRDLRNSKGWTLDSVAVQVGMTKGRLSEYENGKRSVRLMRMDKLSKMAEIYGCSIMDLMEL